MFPYSSEPIIERKLGQEPKGRAKAENTKNVESWLAPKRLSLLSYTTNVHLPRSGPAGGLSLPTSAISCLRQ